METKAHYVLIGAFTLLMIAAGFGLVLFFSGMGSISPRKTVEVIFSGSVAGLSRGAAVTFNGLHIGEVTSMGFLPNDPSRVAAFVQIENSAPVRADVKARLESQGLTGAAVIALTGGSPDAPALTGKDGAPPILNGEPSQIQNLLGRVDALSAKADDLLAKADKLLGDNADALTDTVHNVDAFSKALSDNASGLQGALASIADLSRRAGPLADRLTKLTDDADRTLNALDAGKINGILDDVSKFTGALSQSGGDVKSLLQNAADASGKIDDALGDIRGTLATVDGLVKAVDTQKLATLMDGAAALGGALRDNRDNISVMLKNASEFSGRINDAVANLKGTLVDLDAVVQAVDRQKIAAFMDGAGALGSALSDNRGNIDTLIKSASELSAKLDESADRLDGLFASVQGFLGSPDVKGPIGQIGEAAKSVRQLADDVDLRIKELSGGLVRFSNSGLKEYEGLAVDGRRAVNDFDRLVHSLEGNPSQLLFGAKK